MSSIRMDQTRLTEEILTLNLEIISLLTGETFAAVRSGDLVAIMAPQHTFIIPKRINKQKIMELISKVCQLLVTETGDPGQCNSAATEEIEEYWEPGGMEELQHSDGHREAMMEDQPTDGSNKRITLERCLHPPYPGDSTQEEHHQVTDGSRKRNPPETSPCHINFQDSAREEHEIPHHDQNEKPTQAEGERTEEEACFWGDSGSPVMLPLLMTVAEEERSTDITTARGHTEEETLERGIALSPIWITDDEDTTQDSAIFTANHHQGLYGSIPPLIPADIEQLLSDQCDSGRIAEGPQGEKKFSCPVCGRSFSFKSNLVAHYRTHTGERPFQCPECGKGFVHKYSLTAHRRYHTGEKLHACSECGKKFSLKSDLQRHHKSHTGEKPHMCPECGKCFVHKFHLYAHQRSHVGEKPYACSQCGKSFVFKSQLDAHQRFHTGQTSFSCPDCGKNFMWRRDLIRHLRVHTREKPYSCSECGKSFFSNSDLVRHQKGHTGEKPHTCSHCGKSFLHKFRLTSHLRTHEVEAT